MQSEIIKATNFFSEFKEWYYKIINDFNFDEQQDKLARDLLLEILLDSENYKNFTKNLKNLKKIIQKYKSITIFGCGPSLVKTVEKIFKKNYMKFPSDQLIIAADGAAVFLRKKGIKSNLIFSDLDGFSIKNFSYFVKHANCMVIHAHGDNIENLKKISKVIKVSKNIIGTTQTEPKSIVLNPGGFTDGDRTLFFLRNFIMPHQKIFFIGMDFGNIIGQYSKPEFLMNQKASPIKEKKLYYAKELLEWITEIIRNEIYFVDSEISSDKFKHISPSEYLHFLKSL